MRRLEPASRSRRPVLRRNAACAGPPHGPAGQLRFSATQKRVPLTSATAISPLSVI